MGMNVLCGTSSLWKRRRPLYPMRISSIRCFEGMFHWQCTKPGLIHTYSSEQHWSLMPLHACMSLVRPASFMYGQAANNQGYSFKDTAAFPQYVFCYTFASPVTLCADGLDKTRNKPSYSGNWVISKLKCAWRFPATRPKFDATIYHPYSRMSSNHCPIKTETKTWVYFFDNQYGTLTPIRVLFAK